jgi:hypothetical protein
MTADRLGGLAFVAWPLRNASPVVGDSMFLDASGWKRFVTAKRLVSWRVGVCYGERADPCTNAEGRSGA